MARFVIPITIELHFEANSAQDALHKFYSWRKFIAVTMRGYLEQKGLFRFPIPPVREITQVDSLWLDNHKLRAKFQREWEYRVSEERLGSQSKVAFVHRVAIGLIKGSEGKI